MSKRRQFIKFLVPLIFVSFLNFDVTLATNECCPGTYLNSYKSSFCSDNKTRVNIDCPNGNIFIEENGNQEQFSVNENGALVYYDGSKVEAGEFCVGYFWNNESTPSSNQVALICSSVVDEPKHIFRRILIFISILFLSITLYIYAVLPNLRDIRDKCLIVFICSLMSGYLNLNLLAIFPPESPALCIFLASTLYFFMFSTFVWNNIITFDIWRAVRNDSCNLSNRKCFFIYALWGFGVPLLMIGITFTLDNVPAGNHLRPGFSERCWFAEHHATWSYFYGPISVLLLLNLLMFLHCSFIFWKNRRDDRFSRHRSLKYKYFMYLKLFLVMGLTWIFEVISYATRHYSHLDYLWFFTDCINCGQGILIFLIFVVCRQKVRLGLLKRKMCGINWPKSWGEEALLESSETSDAKDIELGVQKQKIMSESQNGIGVD